MTPVHPVGVLRVGDAGLSERHPLVGDPLPVASRTVVSALPWTGLSVALVCLATGRRCRRLTVAERGSSLGPNTLKPGNGLGKDVPVPRPSKYPDLSRGAQAPLTSPATGQLEAPGMTSRSNPPSKAKRRIIHIGASRK
jgi:hypothetical protein